MRMNLAVDSGEFSVAGSRTVRQPADSPGVGLEIGALIDGSLPHAVGKQRTTGRESGGFVCHNFQIASEAAPIEPGEALGQTKDTETTQG